MPQKPTYQELEQRIQELEAMNKTPLKKAQAIGNIGTWELNISENSLIWTEETYKIFGVPLDTKMDLERFLDCVHPEDREYVSSKFNAALRKNEEYDIEHRIVVGDKVKWVREKAYLECDQSGEALKAIGFVQDITDHKLVEKALQESEALLNEIGSIAKIGGWKIDLETQKLTWTKEVYNLHEVDVDFQPTVEKAISFYEENSELIIQEAVDNAIQNGTPFDVELKIITAKNNVLDVRALGDIERDKNGKAVSVIGTFQDITDRKRAEETLKESEERFELAMNASNDGLFDWNLITNEIYYSPGWKRMIGYEDDEIPNDFSVWEKTTAPEDVKKSWEMQQKLITKQIDRFVLEFKMKHKNGHWVEILSRAKAIFNDEGKAIRIVGTHTDVTERNRAEREKQELLQQLHHKNKMDSIGELAGGIAHDFNNVLNGIISASELLRLPKQGLNEKSLRYVDMIIQTSIRAADLINKLLAFSRKGKIMSSKLNVHDILDDVVEILSRTIDKKIRISTIKDAPNDAVIGDHSAIESAFINMGINASHAMPGGGELLFRTKNFYVSHEYCKSSSFEIAPGDYLEIEIVDTGQGISQENLLKIFEPFYSTKGPGKGTGLGLSAVYGTIQDHHGSIEVQSDVGAGTTFSILLPCAPETIELVEEKKPVLTGSGTILLVDDEDIVRDLNKDILESLGYNILTAKDGEDSIEIFRKRYSEIDIVIMDMIMPRMNGAEAFYKMKELDKNCKVIIASGYTQNENVDKLMESGLAGYIKKPYKISEISQLLDKIQGFTEK